MTFFRDRQPEVRGVLKDGNTFVRDVEENHSRAQNAPVADDIHIQDVGHTHQDKDEHLLKMPLKPISLDSLWSVTAHITPVM